MPNREGAAIHREAKGAGSTARMSQRPLFLKSRKADLNTPYLSSTSTVGDFTPADQSLISVGESMIARTVAFGSNEDIVGDSCSVPC